MDSLFRKASSNPTEIEQSLFHCDAQSISFYMDIAAYLAEHLDGWHTLSLLDIGPRTGAGLAMLRLMHHPLSYSRIKLDPVTGIDLDSAFKETALRLYPDIEPLCGDAFAIVDRKWDLVISSHTIEHVADPAAFLQKAEGLANKGVIIACPFEEEDLIQWHCSRITYKMLHDAGFSRFKGYRSNHWHNSLCIIASRWL